MPDPDEPTKDEVIKVLQEKNAHQSKLIDIQEAQKEHMKSQCIQLRKALAEALSKNAS